MVLAPTLLLNAGSGAAIARPTFSRDFAGEKTLNNGTGPAITFTRASDATYFDADGVLQTASNNVPRFDHSATGSSLGLLIEESRTNSIRNSQAGGAVAGSPGTMPTNWTGDPTPSGLSREIVGTGTINGMSYIDIKYTGTTTATSGFGFSVFETAGQTAATSGQTWTTSVYIALIGGSISGVSAIRPYVEGTNGTNRTEIYATDVKNSLTSTLQRFSHAATLANAGTTHGRGAVDFTYATGQTINTTLRIAAPQFEQGAFPTSYIPTTTAAATRAADFAKIDGISSFYNAAEGSVYTEHTQLVAKTSGSVSKFPWVMNFGANAAYPILGVYAQNQSTDTFLRQAIKIDSAGPVTQAEQGATLALTAGTIHKFIAGYATNNVATYRNGSAGGTDDTVDLSGTTGMERMGIGNLYRDTIGDDYLNGHIRKIAYWPRRLSNTLLQQLTT